MKVAEQQLLCDVLPEMKCPQILSAANIEDGAKQMKVAFYKYFRRQTSSKGDTVEIYICNSNMVRFFTMKALQFSSDAWCNIAPSDAAITWIRINKDGTVSLKYLNSSGFLRNDISNLY